jgi:hypothetical protein
VYLLLTACGGAELQPLTLNATPWGVGEISTYQITDVNGQAAGMGRFDILAGDAQSNPGGWSVRREIEAQGINEIVAVEMSTGLRPVISVLVRTAEAGQQVVKATYNSGQVDIELTSEQNVTTYERMNITSDARDGYVLLPVIRALPLQAGYATRINSFLPLVGLLETFTVEVVDSQDVTVPAGTFAVWEIKLRSNNYTTTLWISQQAPFPIVKFIDGRNQGTFELTDFQPGE